MATSADLDDVIVYAMLMQTPNLKLMTNSLFILPILKMMGMTLPQGR
jgi:hypothetical protein